MIKIILISLVGFACFGQLRNGDFENWNNIVRNTYTDDLIEFGIVDSLTGIPDDWELETYSYGAFISNEAVSGEKSMCLHNWYSYARSWAEFKGEMNGNPTKLTGYYKLITDPGQGESSDGRAFIDLTLFNSGDTISNNRIYFEDKEVFEYFELPIIYNQEIQADSIYIYMVNAVQMFCSEWANICNYFFIDNLKLEYNVNSINSNYDNIIIYPNPSRDKVLVKTEKKINELILFDLMGNKLINSNNNEINVNNLSNGNYLISILFQDGSKYSEILIKK
jgi:hypothetical protein